MAFHIIYFLVILAYGLWGLSLYLKDPILAIISSLLMFPLAIFIFVNGMDIFDYSNLIVQMFGAVTFSIASITSFQAAYELYSNM